VTGFMITRSLVGGDPIGAVMRSLETVRNY
jgi:hypothetical protein